MVFSQFILLTVTYVTWEWPYSFEKSIWIWFWSFYHKLYLICQFGFILGSLQFFKHHSHKTWKYGAFLTHFSNNDVRTRITVLEFVKPVLRSQYIFLKVSINSCFGHFINICTLGHSWPNFGLMSQGEIKFDLFITVGI